MTAFLNHVHFAFTARDLDGQQPRLRQHGGQELLVMMNSEQTVSQYTAV